MSLMEAILRHEIDISLGAFKFDFEAYNKNEVSVYHHSWRFQ